MIRLNIGIVYCGGCNPHFDRNEFVDLLIKQTGDKAHIENINRSFLYDVILVICGCSCACANVKDLKAGKILYITPEKVLDLDSSRTLIDQLLNV